MSGPAVEREFSEGLPDACSALDKLTGARWQVASVDAYVPAKEDEALEAVRLNVDGRASPRFILAVTDRDASPFADRIKGACGLDLPLDAVLAETANIVVSAVLNKMAERCGETLIVTAPQGLRGARGAVYDQVIRPRDRALVARLVAPDAHATSLELLAVWDA